MTFEPRRAFPIALFHILFICLALLAAPSYAEEEVEPLSEEEYAQAVEEYRRDGVTIVASHLWKPFSFRAESGEMVGYLKDIWEAWSKKTGVPIRIVYKDWAETLPSVQDGEADIHSGLYYSDERAEYLSFSTSFHSSSSIFAIKDDGPVDCSNAMVKGVVTVLDGSYTQSYITRMYPEAKVVAYPGMEESIKAFWDDKAEVIVVDYPSLVMFAGGEGAMKGVSICRTLFYREVQAGVLKENVALLKLVDEGLSLISAEELEAIKAQWFVTGIEHKPQLMKAIIPLGIALVVFVGVLAMWFSRRS